MDESKKKFPASVVIIMTIFIGSFIFLIFASVQSGGWTVLWCLPSLFIISSWWMMATEWNPVHKNPNFQCVGDGTIGVCESNLLPIYGGRYRLEVSMRPRYLKGTKWYRMDGVKGFFATLSNVRTIDIIDKKSMFRVINDPDLSAPEGCIQYLGSVTGKKVKTINYHMQERLDFLEHTLSKISTIYEKSKQIAGVESQVNTKNAVDVLQRVGAALNEFNEKQKPQPTQIVVPTAQQGRF